MTAGEAEALFGAMLDGDMADADMAAALIAIADRGEDVPDIVGAVRAIRARMRRITPPPGAIDVTGTGGDGQHSLNISTAVAIVVAACGVPMAKCGNRAASSRAGTADTLEALGLDLTRATARAEDSLADLGIAFIFVQHQVPALARIAPVRRDIGRRTIFNLLGPLVNFSGVERQLMGVPSPHLVALYVDAARELGFERSMIVSGEEGLDEISISGPSIIARIGLSPADERVTPATARLADHPIEALRGGDAAFNAAALRRLLAGETGAYRDAVLFNAAGALIVAGAARDWIDGVEEAAEAIDKGLAKVLLDCWIAF